MNRTLFFCASAVFTAASLSAQVQTGTISGTVSDSQNAVIAGAQVEVRHVGTNTSFQTKTNESGFYAAPGLAIGEYEVVAQLQGFKRSVRSGITLQVNQNARVNFQLEVG